MMDTTTCGIGHDERVGYGSLPLNEHYRRRITEAWGNNHEVRSEIMNWIGAIAKEKPGSSFSAWYIALLAKAEEVLTDKYEHRTTSLAQKLQQAFDSTTLP